MTQNKSSEQEVDLGTVYGIIRREYHKLLINFYRGTRFLLRTWIWILALLIAGFALGFYFDNQKSELGKAELIVQINFDSANYVYSTIEQLNAMIAGSNHDFLKSNGFYSNGGLLIRKVEIEPIVNLNEIIPDEDFVNHGYVQAVFEKSKFKDDLLTSDVFIQKYKSHKITVESASKDTEVVLNSLLNYLNGNKLINEIKLVKVESTKNIIKENEYSIAAIDSIAKLYGTILSGQKSTGQVYFNYNDQSNQEFHMLFEEKSSLLKENEELQIELLKYDNIVTVLNNPELHIDSNRFKQKKVLLPILFFVGFMTIMIFIKIYRKAKALNG